MNRVEQWREQAESADRPLPWWLWPVALLWRRRPSGEPDTVPVAVPQYVDTVPVDRHA